MVTLNDYLYSGDTMFKILKNYSRDLKAEAKQTNNEIDLIHANFLIQIRELLEHNDFLTAQSQKIREFYIHMAKEYPLLAFNFKGRIKSLIRSEAKFNGYIVEYIYDCYTEHKTFPSISDLKQRLSCFRDLIAYRIVISLPKCYLKPGESQQEADIRYRYQIANEIPEGACVYFDEAYERCQRLVSLKLAELDVNMFTAINNDLVNDGCGLYRGRLILPYEHLSRHQNELVD